MLTNEKPLTVKTRPTTRYIYSFVMKSLANRVRTVCGRKYLADM